MIIIYPNWGYPGRTIFRLPYHHISWFVNLSNYSSISNPSDFVTLELCSPTLRFRTGAWWNNSPNMVEIIGTAAGPSMCWPSFQPPLGTDNMIVWEYYDNIILYTLRSQAVSAKISQPLLLSPAITGGFRVTARWFTRNCGARRSTKRTFSQSFWKPPSFTARRWRLKNRERRPQRRWKTIGKP